MRSTFGISSIRFQVNSSGSGSGGTSDGSLPVNGSGSLPEQDSYYVISGSGTVGKTDREDLYAISGSGSVDSVTSSSGGGSSSGGSSSGGSVAQQSLVVPEQTKLIDMNTVQLGALVSSLLSALRTATRWITAR